MDHQAVADSGPSDVRQLVTSQDTIDLLQIACLGHLSHFA